MNDTIRAFLASANAGTPIDAPALAAALFDAAASGVDMFATLRAFEPQHRIHLESVRGADGARFLRQAREAHGWRGAIRAASVIGWSDAWAAAMTAYYGPTGLHKSRCDANGCPTAETLANLPNVRETMEDAARRWENTLAYYERNGGATRWEYVVRRFRA